MYQPTYPLKQIVRDYMDKRTQTDDPPPTPEEIRRQLGWHMMPANQQPDRVDRD